MTEYPSQCGNYLAPTEDCNPFRSLHGLLITLARQLPLGYVAQSLLDMITSSAAAIYGSIL